MGVREGKESSHTPILPHTHTEKDDYFPGMALTSPQDASAGVRLMMTAVRSSCCAVPSANSSTTAWSQEMISSAGNSPCWIERAMLRSCSIHPARFRRRNAYRAKAGQTSAARTGPPPASRISSCPACTRSARCKRVPAGQPVCPSVALHQNGPHRTSSSAESGSQVREHNRRHAAWS